jgi:uncharacterized protein involved in exopolysaccharide biosynthesis
VARSADAFAEPGGVSGKMIDLGALTPMALRHWRRAGLAFAAGSVLVAGGLLAFPFKYTAEATLIIAPPEHVVKAEEVVSPVGQDPGSLEGQVQIMLSNGFLRDLARDLKLDEDPAFLSKIGARSAAAPPDERLQAIAEVFRDQLKVARRGLTSVIDVDYAAKDPELAARYANAVAQHFVDYQRDERKRGAEQASKWLGERIAAMRQKVIDAEKAASDFRAANGLIEAGAGNSLIERQLTDITQQLGAARTKLAEAKARFDELQKAHPRAGAPDLSEALQSPAIVNLRGQYATATRNLADLAAVLGDRHPQVVSARAQVEDLRQQLEKELGRVRASARNDYDVAQAQEATLAAALTKLRGTASSSDEATVRLRELEREVTASNALYEEFIGRQKETAAQENLLNNDTRIISSAVAPPHSGRPKTPVLAGVSIVAGLLAALIAVLAAEAADTGLESPEQVRRYLGLPCLGIAPRIVDEEAGIDAPGIREAIRAMRGVVNTARMTLIIPASAANSGECGRLAWELAKALTRDGVPTLFVDLESDEGSETGLADVLYRRAPVEDAIHGRRGRPSVLPVGTADADFDPAELLVHPRIASVLESLRDRFGVILVNAPPASPTLRGLLAICDATILVVGWREARRERVAAIASAIAAYSDAPIHTLLNQVDMSAYARTQPRVARAG